MRAARLLAASACWHDISIDTHPAHPTHAVVGAGLAGSMMALMLGKRGFFVDVYEKRPDFRVAERTAVTPKCVVTRSRPRTTIW